MTDAQAQRETMPQLGIDPEIVEHITSIVNFRHSVADAEKCISSDRLPIGALANLRAILKKELQLAAPDMVSQLPRLWHEESKRTPAPEKDYHFDHLLLLQSFSGQESALKEVLAKLHNEFAEAFKECSRPTTG